MPLPTLRQPMYSRSTNDFTFVLSGQTSRSEVEAKLGAPDLFCADLHVDVYTVNKVRRRKAQLLFFIIPVGWFWDYPGFDFDCIEFDDKERVHRYGMVTFYTGNIEKPSRSDLQYAAKMWIDIGNGIKREY